MDYYSTFTPPVTLTSSYSSPTKPNSQDDHEQQQRKGSAECRVCEHSETDANSSSISSDDEDHAESTADSDTFFNTKNALNQLEELDDLLEACSCTTGEEMPDMYVDDDDEDDNVDTAAAMSCRGVEKELESYEEDEIRKGKRKREEDKAFWEACLAYGY